MTLSFLEKPKNRGTLIELKNKKKILIKGRDLLKKKLDGLILELYKRLKKFKQLRENLQEHLRNGYSYLENYIKTKGSFGAFVDSFESPEIELKEWQSKSILGVKVFDYLEKIIGKELLEIDSLDLNLAKAREEMTKAVEIIVQIAKEEDAIRKILDEIKRVKRKKLFLEKNIIPAVEQKIREIKLALDDEMREEIVKIQRIINES